LRPPEKLQDIGKPVKLNATKSTPLVDMDLVNLSSCKTVQVRAIISQLLNNMIVKNVMIIQLIPTFAVVENN
jgi:hypothetical protein